MTDAPARARARPRLTVVSACRDEAANVRPHYEELKAVLDRLPVDWTLLYVDDASADGTLGEIRALNAADPRVKTAVFSRPFGYHSALVAGLTLSDADLYAIMDVDGEEPPEMLARFHQEIAAGAATVYGIRSQRPEPRWLVFLRRLFYEINGRIADGPTRLWMSEFSMFTREVRDAILDNRTTFPFLRAELANVGLRMSGLDYVRRERRLGRSHYGLWGMARFAVGGFLSSSTLPLRAALYLSAAFAALYALAVPLLRLSLVGAGALASVLGFVFLLLTVPMLALYLARTYKNVTARPVFFLDRRSSLL
ncbi:MAG: glycosyltransferase family 2 protein [Elusimicrobia bacterium]|nr:glycosyltransferase family 2 protein [Elusimicrobiota bacterium]